MATGSSKGGGSRKFSPGFDQGLDEEGRVKSSQRAGDQYLSGDPVYGAKHEVIQDLHGAANRANEHGDADALTRALAIALLARG